MSEGIIDSEDAARFRRSSSEDADSSKEGSVSEEARASNDVASSVDARESKEASSSYEGTSLMRGRGPGEGRRVGFVSALSTSHCRSHSGRASPGGSGSCPPPFRCFRLLAIDSMIEKKMRTAKKISSSISSSIPLYVVDLPPESGPAIAVRIWVSACMFRYFM